MKKLVHPLVALIILALGMMIMPSAQAKAAVPPPPPKSYTPPANDVVFNNPAGSPAEQLAVMNQVKDAVDSVPGGSYIRFAVYSFSWNPMATALITAHKRGVNVRLLVDSHTETPEIRTLRSELKKSTPYSNTSYLKTCTYSCMSSKPSFIHSHLYLFSRVGNATRVSMISSANPAGTGITESWNNTYTVNDSTLYNANVDNFNDMLPDKTNTDYYHTVESPPYKEYFFPRAGSTKNSDTIYNILNDVSCPSTIKITTYFWTNLRLYLAEKLSDLKKKGCSVEVIYPDGPGGQDTIESKVTAELLDGKIPTYNTRPVNGLYMHNKVLLINGTYQGVAGQKIVYTTSQNLTKTSLRDSNEVMLRIPDARIYGKYDANFAFIRDNYTKRVTPSSAAAAKTTAGLDSARDTRILSDNSPDPDE
ncbi:MAG TPA: phospholipase D-like domain-containing protein [Propionibacteriaceae bacterium]|jgi:PLD-like domain|nr:phospholipase D-like domain-containing protein [Propionibacteriaceae bacterium]